MAPWHLILQLCLWAPLHFGESFTYPMNWNKQEISGIWAAALSLENGEERQREWQIAQLHSGSQD